MKICLITDTHIGARSDSQHFAMYFKRFYDEVFFPYLDEHGIKAIIHLGDIVDRRKYINFQSAKRLREDIIEPIVERGIDAHFIIGNHDAYFKNTNEVNSMNELYSSHPGSINVYSEPTEIVVGDLPIMIMPWINSSNMAAARKAIDQTKAEVLMGHLELKGFEMYRGAVNDHGLDPSFFRKFDQVFSGHFHHRSQRGNVTYLGAPYQITWSDFNDDRGFHVYDTETRELEYVKNSLYMFHKIYYNDTDWEDPSWISDLDLSIYKDAYIKVVVINKTNPFWFDLFIERLEKAGVADFQVVDDNLNINLEDDSDIVDEAEDTLTILSKYVDGVSGNVDKNDLKKLIRNLYEEAMAL